MVVTFKIEENKCILGYGEGWEAYFNHSGYKGFVEIKFKHQKKTFRKKCAGESYGKKEGY